MESHNLTSQKVISKIRIEYGDEFAELSGAEAMNWKKAVDSQSVFCYAHGMNFPRLNWVVGKIEEAKIA